MIGKTAFTRLRHNLGSQNLAQVPNIIQQLLDSDGDEMFRLVLLGEFVVGGQGVPPDYDDAALLMAEAGVSHHQHAIPNGDAAAFLDVWETVNGVFPIVDLRWQLAHVFDMDGGTMNRLGALDGGFAMQTQNYAGTLLFTDDGPPFPQPTRDQVYPATFGRFAPGNALRGGDSHFRLFQNLSQAASGVLADHHHRVALPLVPPDIAAKLLQLSVILGGRLKDGVAL